MTTFPRIPLQKNPASPKERSSHILATRTGCCHILSPSASKRLLMSGKRIPLRRKNQHELLVLQSMKLINLLSTDRTILQIYLDFSGATSQKTSEQFLAALDTLEAKLLAFLEDWNKTSSEAIRTDLAPADLAAGMSAFVTTAAIYRSCGKIGSDAECRALLGRQFQAWLSPDCR